MRCAATTMPRWTICTRERRRPAPVEVAWQRRCSQVGVGRRPGVGCAEGCGQIRRDEARRAPANGRATVIMVCREAWSAIGVVEPRGFRWIGRSARLDSHVWDAG